VDYLKESYTPVVAELGDDRWKVAKPNAGKTINWWLVYREDQTKPKHAVPKPAIVKEDSSPDFSSVLDYFDSPFPSYLSPLSPSPSPIRCSKHRKASPHQDLLPLLTDSRNRAVNKGNRAYFPEGMDRSDWPEDYRDAATQGQRGTELGKNS
jgi:hypothetical protein